jgi:hypothetical protein
MFRKEIHSKYCVLQVISCIDLSRKLQYDGLFNSTSLTYVVLREPTNNGSGNQEIGFIPSEFFNIMSHHTDQEAPSNRQSWH